MSFDYALPIWHGVSTKYRGKHRVSIEIEIQIFILFSYLMLKSSQSSGNYSCFLVQYKRAGRVEKNKLSTYLPTLVVSTLIYKKHVYWSTYKYLLTQ